MSQSPSPSPYPRYPTPLSHPIPSPLPRARSPRSAALTRADSRARSAPAAPGAAHRLRVGPGVRLRSALPDPIASCRSSRESCRCQLRSALTRSPNRECNAAGERPRLPGGLREGGRGGGSAGKRGGLIGEKEDQEGSIRNDGDQSGRMRGSIRNGGEQVGKGGGSIGKKGGDQK